MSTLFIQQPGEEIREIEDFPGYWASNFGRIVSAPKPGKGGHPEWVVLNLTPDKDGYQQVRIRCGGKGHTKKVHDLVGRAFNDFSGLGNQWRHFPDKTKVNNRSDNLVWGSNRENVLDKCFDENPDFAQDCYIHESKNPKDRKKPFHIWLPINGKQRGLGGNHATFEESQMMRDWLCNKHGISLPELEAIP
jgi:hypothetical protein